MNKYQPHVWVIPEDEATRQLADGFVLHHGVSAARIGVAPPAGGWSNVRDTFAREYVPYLRQHPAGHVVMAIDFDGKYVRRRKEFDDAVPHDLSDRVFVIGVRTTPEATRRALKQNFENIGRRLAEDCDGGTTTLWNDEDFKHNEPDRLRLLDVVRPFLFASGG